ncbi:spore germination protein KB [Natronincola peptidivorans]|uniref:Spore germination protein KB n=1 Tax=Natronincola peptidivorans TaxID=426128 RepID=A0A1I0CVE7_9FIRM|nr:endospore germination permease [Natronincola peptidivorans]SET23716.1 spore germination protein KB [Natronincola peptidivorans]
MGKQVQISPYQFTILLIGFIIGSTVIIIPGVQAKQDAWLAYILGWMGGFLLFSIYLVLYQRHPGKTLVEIHQILLGKWLGNTLSILYIWYFLHLGTLVLRNFTEYTITISLPETPMWFMAVLSTSIVAYSVKSGLEVTSRMGELVVPFTLAFNLGVTLLLTPHMELNNLLPFLENGMTPVLEASFSVLTFPFGETVVFLMIFPYVNEGKALKKSFVTAFLLAGALLLLANFREVMVLGGSGIERKVFPPHLTTKRIPNLNLDPLIGVVFYITGGIKMCVCYLVAAMGLAQLTKSNDHRVFVYPIGVVIIGSSMWIYTNIAEMLRWAIAVWPYYSIPFQIMIPILLLVISFIKQMKKTTKSSS